VDRPRPGAASWMSTRPPPAARPLQRPHR
jgi:hypothetical protein